MFRTVTRYFKEKGYGFIRGVFPIGCGIGDKQGEIYHVFIANRKYFDMIKLIHYENGEMKQRNIDS